MLAKVEYFCDSIKIGESITTPYVLNWSGVHSGTHILTSKATDRSGKTSVSSPIQIRGSDIAYMKTSEVDYTFDSYTGSDGNTPPSEFGTYSSGNGNIYGILNSEGYQVRMTQEVAGTGASGRINFSTAITGFSRFDTRVMMDNTALSRNVLTIRTANLQDNTFLKFDSDGNIYLILSNGTMKLVSQYQSGVWYNIQLEIDMASKTYIVYINDVALSPRATLPNSSSFTSIVGAGFSQSSASSQYGELNINYLKVMGLSTAVNIKMLPVVSLNVPSQSPQGYIRLSADVKDLDGSVTRVEFYSNNKLVGQALKAPYVFDYYESVIGIKSVYIQVIDDGGSLVTSSIFSLNVTANNNLEAKIKEIRVLDYNFTDNAGNNFDTLPLNFNGDVVLSLQNNTDSTASFDVYVAMYIDKKLLRTVKTTNVTLSKNCSTSVVLKGISLADITGADKIKLYLWSANYAPIGSSIQIEIGG